MISAFDSSILRLSACENILAYDILASEHFSNIEVSSISLTYSKGLQWWAIFKSIWCFINDVAVIILFSQGIEVLVSDFTYFL